MPHCIPCGQESSWYLSDNVAPEEACVDETDGLRGPLELGDALHLDHRDTDVAPDAEADDESDGHQPGLGVPLGHVATRTLGLAVLVDFANFHRPVQVRLSTVRNEDVGLMDAPGVSVVHTLNGILK